MLADYFTKPEQGEKFRAFRDHIMGVPEKFSSPRPSSHASTKVVISEKATEVESNLETSHSNSQRILSTGVCWDSIKLFEILSSW